MSVRVAAISAGGTFLTGTESSQGPGKVFQFGRLQKPMRIVGGFDSLGHVRRGVRMADRAPGFFDVEERLKELSAKGDALERLNAVVDFELFRRRSSGRCRARTARRVAGRRSTTC